MRSRERAAGGHVRLHQRSGQLLDKTEYVNAYVASADVRWERQDVADVRVTVYGDAAVAVCAIDDVASFGGEGFEGRFRSRSSTSEPAERGAARRVTRPPPGEARDAATAGPPRQRDGTARLPGARARQRPAGGRQDDARRELARELRLPLLAKTTSRRRCSTASARATGVDAAPRRGDLRPAFRPRGTAGRGRPSGAARGQLRRDYACAAARAPRPARRRLVEVHMTRREDSCGSASPSAASSGQSPPRPPRRRRTPPSSTRASTRRLAAARVRRRARRGRD